MDEYTLEILISLGIVAATYAIALRLHLSGPIAVVMTGLLMGNRGVQVGIEHVFDSVEVWRGRCSTLNQPRRRIRAPVLIVLPRSRDLRHRRRCVVPVRAVSSSVVMVGSR